MSEWDEKRAEMVELLECRYGIHDVRVLAAMGEVPRHQFIPAAHQVAAAYGDHPLPIGYGQTISQPFIVAYMTQLLQLKGGERVLEIGSGCGYQSAVLAHMGASVYGVERVPELVAHAQRVLKAEGYDAAQVVAGDGYLGWLQESPFDAVIAGCAPPDIPPALVEQLRDGGRLVLPVGGGAQRLVVVQKRGCHVEVSYDLAVRFVPMVPGVIPS